MAAVGDECLRTVQHPAVALAYRRRTRTRGIGAGAGLGQSPCGQPLAGGELRNVAAMLRGITGKVDVVHAKGVMRGHDDADRPVDGRYLLDRHHVIDVAQLRASQLSWNEHAQQPHVTQLLHHGSRKLACLVPFHDVRCNLFCGKGAYLAAQLLLFLRQAEGVAGCVGEGG